MQAHAMFLSMSEWLYKKKYLRKKCITIIIVTVVIIIFTVAKRSYLITIYFFQRKRQNNKNFIHLVFFYLNKQKWLRWWMKKKQVAECIYTWSEVLLLLSLMMLSLLKLWSYHCWVTLFFLLIHISKSLLSNPVEVFHPLKEFCCRKKVIQTNWLAENVISQSLYICPSK